METETSDKLWNSNYTKVMLCNFCIYFAFYVFTPLLPIYLKETFGASKDIIGIVLSGYAVATILTRPVSGYVADAFNRQKVLAFSFLLFFLFFIGYILAGSLLIFAIFRTLHGSPFGAVTVANSTVAIDVLPSSRRNEGIGLYGLSNNLATAIAPFVGIYIYQTTHNFDTLFWTAMAFAGIGLLCASKIRIPERAQVRNTKKISLDRFFLLRGWILALSICAFGFSYGIIQNYLALYSKEVLGDESGAGKFFFLLSAGLVASRLQGKKSLREGKITRNARMGVITSLIGYATFFLVQNPVGYYGSAILIGLGNGHMYPAFQNMFVGIAHHNERGTASSSILTAWDCGTGIGLLLGGVFAEHFGYGGTFGAMVAFNLIGTIIFFVVGEKDYTKKSEIISNL